MSTDLEQIEFDMVIEGNKPQKKTNNEVIEQQTNQNKQNSQ